MLGRYSMYVDHTGKKFGRWTAIRRDLMYVKGNLRWICHCECGKEKSVLLFHLVGGKSLSCGCLQKESVHRTHGLSHTRTYYRWWDMLRRCNDPRHSSWLKYGVRGIKVCERWHTFENFFSDMGHPPAGLTIHRIDNDGDYCPENCKWATNEEQSRNTRRNFFITFNGVTLILTDWAKRLNMSNRTLRGRLRNYGWSVERALTEPVHIQRP